LKGKHKDRDDKDLDNDGDSDESDRYLHKRRKAISKKMDQEDAKEEVEIDEILDNPNPRGKHHQVVNPNKNYKSATGRQRTASGKMVPGHWKKMSSDDLKKRLMKDRSTKKEEVETEAFANPPKGMKFPTTGVKKGNLKDLEKHNKDLRAKKEEVEVDEVNKYQARAFGSALIRDKSPRQLKDPKKEKMVGTKSGTKVVSRDDPKYKNAPEHESVESPWIRAAVAHLDKVAEKTIMGVKVKKIPSPKDSETYDVKNALRDKDSIQRQQARQKGGGESARHAKRGTGIELKKSNKTD